MDTKQRVQAEIDSCRFGVDYYPEHWPHDRWAQDAAMMRDMGMQVVRMAEFAWHKLEPKQGAFDFAWLDDAIDVMARCGIHTLLGTPTAAPPAWLIEQDETILPVDSQGQRKSFGGRHHDCQSHPGYRAHVRRIVTAMAEHYRDNPNVIGWQIDNELGNSHWDLCMCDHCRQAFHIWLEKKYGTVDALNEAWGTAFWSQTYDRFDQIPAPRQTPTVHNPGLLLDWRRFCSDLVIDFQHEQAVILRRICPHQQLTHNLMGFYDKTDYFKFAKELDFCSNDQYPSGFYFDAPGESPARVSACTDFIRSVKHKNLWMMELQAGPTGGGVIGHTPGKGELALWTAQCVAHGADTIVYFRWRTALRGTEQFWHGILPHSGIPGRRYEELRDAIRRLTPVLDDIHGIVPRADTAILFSYDQDWALHIQPQHPQLDYVAEVQQYYDALHRMNIPVDFVSEGDDLTGYKLVLAPLQFIMTPAMEQKLRDYVTGGGHLLLTMRTGVKDADNACMGDAPLPGGLTDLVGAQIFDYDCQLWREMDMTYGGMTAKAHKWCDLLTPTTARTAAVYASGEAAITVNDTGRGRTWYVGTEPDPTVMLPLMRDVTHQAGVAGLGETPEGVALAWRPGQEQDYLFILNHTEQAQTVAHLDGWEDGEHVLVEPKGVAVLTRRHTA